MARPKRSAPIDLQEAIKAAAWKQIAQEGAAALSLRAVARELHITAPAIYNYFNRRDDLVSALIIDAFDSFGQAQMDAVEFLPKGDFAGRLRAAGYAYRQWALEYPQRYQLIFGTPIPGYKAPAEKTQPASSQSAQALIQTLAAALAAGAINTASLASILPELSIQFEDWKRVVPVEDGIVLYLYVSIWCRVHGLVSIEIGNQFPPFIKDPGVLYQNEIEAISQWILKS